MGLTAEWAEEHRVVVVYLRDNQSISQVSMSFRFMYCCLCIQYECCLFVLTFRVWLSYLQLLYFSVYFLFSSLAGNGFQIDNELVKRTHGQTT